MSLSRRRFLTLTSISAASALMSRPSLAGITKTQPIKAIAFDGFPIFDPRPIFALAETLFPGNGKALSAAWRTRQFEYQWLRALSGQYVDFWQATEDGLTFATTQLKLNASKEQSEQLMNAYLNLKPWPDVIPALKILRSMNIRLTFLSNLTPQILSTNMRHSGLDDYFENAISTDQIKTYKPDARAYQLGVDILKLKREEIAFAAFASWDAAGAKWFGYPTFWVNRAGSNAEKLGVSADGTGKGMPQLVQFIKSRNA